MADVTIGKGYRHIVDVDGLLIGIDEKLITPVKLLAHAGCGGDRRLLRLVGEHALPLQKSDAILLHEDELLVFRSEPDWSGCHQLRPRT